MSNRRKITPGGYGRRGGPAHRLRRMHVLGAAVGGTVIPRHEASAWLRGRLDALTKQTQQGWQQRCPHLPPHGDRVPIVALWAPHLAVCGDCLLLLRPEGIEDRRCDWCGVVAESIVPAAVAPGPDDLLVLFGLCHSCHHREAAA